MIINLTGVSSTLFTVSQMLITTNVNVFSMIPSSLKMLGLDCSNKQKVAVVEHSSGIRVYLFIMCNLAIRVY